MMYQGAKCKYCRHESGATNGIKADLASCAKCVNRNGMPGFDPKPGVRIMRIETVQGPMGRVINE